MTTYTITVPGVARGKQRARVTRNGHAYTPQQTVNAEAWIKACAMEQGVREPLEGPLSLGISIRRSVPASWSKRKRSDALNCVILPCTKPDASNVCKTFEDALNGIAWKDDAQIVELYVRKSYADSDSTIVEVRQIL